MKRKEKYGYWNAQKNALIKSFKNIIRKEFFKSALFDLITIIAVVLVLNVTGLLADRITMPVFPQLLDVLELKQAGDQQAFENAMIEVGPAITKVIWTLLAILLISFILLVFLVSLFYGNAWLSCMKKSFNNIFFRKYFMINMIWFLSWTVITLLIIFLLAPHVALILLIVEMVLFFYLDPVMRTVFDESKSLLSNLKRFFRTGRKFYWFIPFIILSAVFASAIAVITSVTLSIEWLMISCFIMSTLLFVGWMRNYIVALVNEMKG